MSISKSMLAAIVGSALLTGCHQGQTPETDLPTSQASPTQPGDPSSIQPPKESLKPAVSTPLSFEKTDTGYFTILLPPNWTVEEQARGDGDPDATFEVHTPEGEDVFDVIVATDKPRFIQCFCAPWKDYALYDKDGLKYADLTMDIGSSSVRTLKAVGAKYGTDVHIVYEKHDQEVLDRIIESIRPF